MNTQQKLQLIIGVMIFLITTTLTYCIVVPTRETNTTADILTNKMTNISTNTTSNNNPLTNFYHITTSITVGGVIGIVTVFLLFSANRH